MRNFTVGSVSIGRRKLLGQILMLAILTAAVCFPLDMLQAETRWTPSVNFSATQDDNIFFEPTDIVDDNIYQLDPGIRYNYDQELTKLSADARVRIRKYQDNDELDDETYRINLNGQSNITERLGLNGRYEFIKDTTLDSELEEVGRIFTREERRSHYASLNPNFKISETTSIGISGGYRDVAYDSDDDVDYSRWDVGVPVRWRLATEIDSVYIKPGYTYTDSDTNRTTSYNFRIGWSHESTERLNLNLAVGARYTEFEDKNTDEEEETWNGLGSLKMKYDFETGYFSVDLLHDLRNTADGNQVNVSRVIMQLKWYFTERMGWELDGRYYYTVTEGNINDDSTEFIRVGPELFYQLTENHLVFIAYEYSQEDQKDVDIDPRSERNRIWAGVRLNFPL